MTLRCRPGDLAEIIVTPRVNPAARGRLVDVICLAPPGAGFTMPDGGLHAPVGKGYWVVRVVGDRLLVPFGSMLNMRRRSFVVTPDHYLRPIRPDAEPVDVERDEPVEVA